GRPLFLGFHGPGRCKSEASWPAAGLDRCAVALQLYSGRASDCCYFAGAPQRTQTETFGRFEITSADSGPAFDWSTEIDEEPGPFCDRRFSCAGCDREK